jgi:hypothetical protein
LGDTGRGVQDLTVKAVRKQKRRGNPMKRLVILVSAVLMTISSVAFAATSEKFGQGGWIQDFQPEIDRNNASGELFRIKGHCQSNCTLFLGLRNVCVERSATLLFHSGHDRQRSLNANSTNRMLSAYNASLRQYVVDNHYMDSLAFHSISGADIIDKFGYKECPRK